MGFKSVRAEEKAGAQGAAGRIGHGDAEAEFGCELLDSDEGVGMQQPGGRAVEFDDEITGICLGGIGE